MLINFNRYIYHINSWVRLFVIFIFLISFFPGFAWTQADGVDSTMSFDLLLTPPAPGFVLLGKEPASVERPGTVTDLAITILSQTDNLSTLPEDFALEVAPYWLLAGRYLTYEEYANPKNIGSSIRQTLSLSIVSSSNSETSPDPLSTSLALGIRFSLLRGKIDSEFNNYAEHLSTLYEELGKLNEIFASEWRRRIEQDTTIKKLWDEFQKADSTIKPIIEPLIVTQIAQREAEIKQQVEAKIRKEHDGKIKNVKEVISKLRLRRLGWKLDVAGGTVIDFPQRIFDDGSISRWGAWLTSGYEWRKWSVLGVFRFLGNYGDSDKSIIDLGGRLIFDNFKKFSLSCETVYRKISNGSTNEPQWRFALLFDYAIAKNKSISFTFGRDFEGKQSGNLISSVNLLLGLGSDRPVQ